MTQEERRLFLIRRLLEEQPRYRNVAVPEDAAEQKYLLRALLNVRAPVPAAEDFLKVQDAYLQAAIAEKGITDFAGLQPVRKDMYLWQGDITTLRCGAIVNAANSQMLGCFCPNHGCIDNAIHTYAGVQLRLACAELMRRQAGEEETGKAKITPAFNLPCDFVLHTVGPIVSGALREKDKELLASCYRSCLELAQRHHIESIAFCCISTGEFHFPNDTAAQIAVQTVKEYKQNTNSKIKVIWNVFKDVDFKLYQRVLGSPPKQMERLKEALETADSIVVGAGAGLSTSAGFTYSGERFDRYFSDFKEKYQFCDMYAGGFYPYATPEEHWAYWSRYIFINRYRNAPKPVYNTLLELVKNKDYFVITTNVDHCFQKAGFDKERLFYTQGDYGLFQCSGPCCRETFDNEAAVRQMMERQKDMRVPSELLPTCPHCGRPMTMNLRADDQFVEDAGWHEAAGRYERFLRSRKDRRILFLELGVGYNTPVIIKYPFWRMTAQNPRAAYACINYGEAVCPEEIGQQSICISRDIGAVLNALSHG